MTTIPDSMRAVAIDRFGGPEVLRLQNVPVPEPGPGEVLMRIDVAGVGEWDPFEREGGYAEMQGTTPSFPYIPGSEGAGVVAGVGAGVDAFSTGDRVHAAGFLNPRGGFYAEYVVIDAGLVSHTPAALSTEQAGVLSGVALTALRGLQDVLAVKAGESLAILGASGGIGHVAVQLAKRMGARVLAIGSGADGTALARRLGADAAADGRSDDVPEALRRFAADGLDAALLTAGGDTADQVVAALRDGGRAAFPNGVQPAPGERAGTRVTAFNGEPDPELVQRLDRFLADAPLQVHVARTFPLEQVAAAHRALGDHYLGKLALQVR